MHDFTGKSALIVGGGTMGAEIAAELADGGARLFTTYHRNRGQANELASRVSGHLLGQAQLDISDQGAVADVVERAATVLGGIDVLVTTTGYVHRMTPLLDLSFEDIVRTLDVELRGVIVAAKYVLPYMREAGYGRMVFVGSDSGKVGSSGETASSAARGGVIAFAKALARESAREDICVNVVCPGPTEGPLFDGQLADDGVTGKIANALLRAVPKRRAARPGEVAALATFLASGAASYITGQAISVSGGLTMSS